MSPKHSHTETCTPRPPKIYRPQDFYSTHRPFPKTLINQFIINHSVKEDQILGSSDQYILFMESQVEIGRLLGKYVTRSTQNAQLYQRLGFHLLSGEGRRTAFLDFSVIEYFISSESIRLKSKRIFFRGGTSLVAQWLRLHTPNAGGWGPIPGQGTRSHVLQLRVCMPQPKILCVTTKTWHSQINNRFLKKRIFFLHLQ